MIRKAFSLAAAALIFSGASASATTISIVGDDDGFLGVGETSVQLTQEQFTGVSAGDPSGFNEILGGDARWTDYDPGNTAPLYGYCKIDGTWEWSSDPDVLSSGGANCGESEQWRHFEGTYGTLTYFQEVTGVIPAIDNYGVLELGIYDHDSYSDSTMLDVLDVLWGDEMLNTTPFEGISVPESSFHVVQLRLTMDQIEDALADGGIFITITTNGSSPCKYVADQEFCGGNSFGIDYSKLMTVVPLPVPALLLLGGLGALGATRRRK